MSNFTVVRETKIEDQKSERPPLEEIISLLENNGFGTPKELLLWLTQLQPNQISELTNFLRLMEEIREDINWCGHKVIELSDVPFDMVKDFYHSNKDQIGNFVIRQVQSMGYLGDFDDE